MAEEEKTVEDLAKELETLKAENQELKEKKTQEKPDNPPKPSNGEPTDEQWEKLEERFGKSRDEIKATWEMITAATEPLARENQALRRELQETRVTTSIKDDLKKSEKDFGKLEKHYDEFMADIPQEIRADEKEMKKWNERALAYAKGKVGYAKPVGGDVEEELTGDDIGEDVPANQDDSRRKEKDYFGTHTTKDQKIRLEVEKLVDDDYRKENAHPERPGAVLVNEKKEFQLANPRKDRVRRSPRTS